MHDDLSPGQRMWFDETMTHLTDAIEPLISARVPASAEGWSHVIAEHFGVRPDQVEVRLDGRGAHVAVWTADEEPAVTLEITAARVHVPSCPGPPPPTFRWRVLAAVAAVVVLTVGAALWGWR